MLKKIIAILVMLCAFGAPLSAAAESISLSSLSAVLYEPQTGRVLYAKDPDTKRPMASTTKLMTALVVAEQLPLDKAVTIPAAAVAVEGSSMGLRGGDTLTVRDLLTGMLLSSGNDAANAAALLSSGSLPSFAARMNTKAQELGMTKTVFVTPSGLDEGEHGSTARDMAVLGAAVLRDPDLAAICAAQRATVTLSGNRVTLKNHNRLLSLYEPTVGLKTGFTKKSGRCLVSAAQRDGVTLVVATLNGGDYWNDHIALYEYGFSQTESVVLPQPSVSPIAVAGGVLSEVSCEIPCVKPQTLRKGEAAQVTCEVRLPSFLWAPVSVGDEVGTVRYRLGDMLLQETPIRLAENVAARPPFGFFKNWGRHLGRLLAALMR